MEVNLVPRPFNRKWRRSGKEEGGGGGGGGRLGGNFVPFPLCGPQSINQILFMCHLCEYSQPKKAYGTQIHTMLLYMNTER